MSVSIKSCFRTGRGYRFAFSVILMLLFFFFTFSASSYAQERDAYPGEKISFTFSEGVLFVTGEGEISDYTSKDELPWKNLAVEELVIGKGITSIGDRAFEGLTGLKSLLLPASLKRIGRRAFYGCVSLKSLKIPDEVEIIERDAFRNCTALKRVTLGSGIRTIEEKTFSFCTELEQITFPEGLTEIGSSAFSFCRRLYEIRLPDSVKYLDDMAFYGCSGIHTLILSKQLEKIGSQSFAFCEGLSSVKLPDGLSVIGEKAFMNTGLVGIRIPASVQELGDRALGFSMTDNGSLEKIPSFCIYGFTNTLAESYAKTSGLSFQVPQKNTITVSGSLSKNWSANERSFYLKASAKDGAALSFYSNDTRISVNKSGKVFLPAFFIGNFRIYICCAQTDAYLASERSVVITVRPPMTELVSLVKKSASSVTAVWTRKEEADGYQLQYSADPTFLSDLNSRIISDWDTEKKRLYGLNGGYLYVRIRTFKDVGDKRLYSSFSEVKSLKL